MYSTICLRFAKQIESWARQMAASTCPRAVALSGSVLALVLVLLALGGRPGKGICRQRLMPVYGGQKDLTRSAILEHKTTISDEITSISDGNDCMFGHQMWGGCFLKYKEMHNGSELLL